MDEKELEQWGEKIEPLNADAVDFTIEPMVVGLYIDKKTNVGPNESNMYIIKKEDGTVVSVWGSTVLDARMLEVPVGMEVLIKFTGTKKGPKSPKPYKVYDVYARKPISLADAYEKHEKEQEGK